MNKKIFKVFIIIAIIIATMILFTTISHASSLSISTSKSTVEPGEVFIVTVTLNGGAGQISATTSNGSGSGSDWLDNSSFSFSCTAGSSGTVSIYASGLAADYTTEMDESVSASKSVSIVVPVQQPPASSGTTSGNGNSSSGNSKPTTTPSTNTTKPSTTNNTPKKSNNSKLSNLTITEGVLTPEFNAGVKEYAISVPNEITKLNITATPEDSKATVVISGNEELQIGENNIEITVTAEDGSKSIYKILATRNQPELSLQTLAVSYIDENGEKVILELTPAFVSNIYEYNIDKHIPAFIDKLEIEALANRENANVEISGNEGLKAGQNEIIIKTTLTNEEGLEEQKTYKIIVIREEEKVFVPLTPIQKLTNWFSGIGSSLKTWGVANFTKIITGMLAVATATFAGLTVYFVHDYKNYKSLVAKLAEFNKANLMERANGALVVENQAADLDIIQPENEIEEEIAQKNSIEINSTLNQDDMNSSTMNTDNIMEQEDTIESENIYFETGKESNEPKSSIAEKWDEFLDVPQEEIKTKKNKGKRFK